MRTSTGRLEIFPCTFTVGTDAKPYTTLSVDRGDYQELQEPQPRYHLNDWDAVRIPDGADWGYLAKNQLDSGPVHVAVRGKCLAFTAGYVSLPLELFHSPIYHAAKHALVCHLGLEGNITPMRLTDYLLIVSPWRCVPGPNKDPEKANLMRTFILPDKFCEPGAREVEKRTINVLAVIRTKEYAFVISDFSRLTRLHVVSSSRKFTSEDLLFELISSSLDVEGEAVDRVSRWS